MIVFQDRKSSFKECDFTQSSNISFDTLACNYQDIFCHANFHIYLTTEHPTKDLIKSTSCMFGKGNNTSSNDCEHSCKCWLSSKNNGKKDGWDGTVIINVTTECKERFL